MRIGRLLLLVLLAATPAQADHDVMILRDRGIALMRHGGAVPATPGTLPPVPGCEPGAVLTEMGRAEMRRWGAELRAAGLPSVTVLTSHQCSAWETALLLDLGPVTPDPLLDAWDRAEAATRGEALRQHLIDLGRARQGGGGPVILVTHRANILAVTGIEASHGELLLLQAERGGLGLLGRLQME
ncbi:histidine phosphatase family protein [Roseomonas stagni]|uniref:Histidine phosphatase family protein n=1 Tax=Falsiroseomonas algicola TaxID=2716930 RepID=A0A6M1LT70_9PROT|nr:histidine phosphatase family protein [Falsiroseomonas algicola]NGM23203.1 histidine phosphatase family protein [Falsiroseomonas algicola]